MAAFILVACEDCGNLFEITVAELVEMPFDSYETFGQKCTEHGGLYGSLDDDESVADFDRTNEG